VAPVKLYIFFFTGSALAPLAFYLVLNIISLSLSFPQNQENPNKKANGEELEKYMSFKRWSQ